MEWVFLGLALLLVVANGFFVATEFAIVKVRSTRLCVEPIPFLQAGSSLTPCPNFRLRLLMVRRSS